MAMTPEKRVKKAVQKQLDLLGAYYFFPATGGFGRSGVPDIIGCYQGAFFAIECKAGSNTTTALQDRELTNIRQCGGAAIIVNEGNMNEVHEWLTNLSK